MLVKKSSIKFIEDYEIALPPLSEQRRVADILSTVDKNSPPTIQKSKLEKIKKSLMNDLLTGKKRVKVT